MKSKNTPVSIKRTAPLCNKLAIVSGLRHLNVSVRTCGLQDHSIPVPIASLSSMKNFPGSFSFLLTHCMQLKAKEAVPIGSTVITAIHNLYVLVSVRFVIQWCNSKVYLRDK